MAILTMPSSGVRNVMFGSRRNTVKTTSPFTRSTQAVSRAGDQWFATWEIAVGTQEMRAEWQAFLMQAANVENRFKAYDHFASRMGTGAGTPLVMGAGQTGNSLIVDGWTAGSGVLNKGDLFSVNDELKMVVADVVANSSGVATLTFEPKIRVSPANNAPVTTVAPYCLMRLVDDEQAQWEVDVNGHYTMSFSGEETFYNA